MILQLDRRTSVGLRTESRIVDTLPPVGHYRFARVARARGLTTPCRSSSVVEVAGRVTNRRTDD